MNKIETVTLFTYFAAFGGGLISFLSPCVMPVVPGYLSIITGLDFAELTEGDRKNMWPVIRDTLLFIAGFSSIFIALGVASASVSDVLVDNQALLTRIGGAIVLSMGLFMLGSIYLRLPWLYQEARFHPDLGRYGRAAPSVAGAAFGFGWTPCIGPVLASILVLAATDGRAVAGATLLAAYSAGLGIPFLVTGLIFGRAATAMSWVRQHLPRIMVGSALVMTFFGGLLVLNQLNWVTSQLMEGARAVGLDFIVELG